LTCRLQFDRVRASILGQISIVTGGEFGDGLVGRTQADDRSPMWKRSTIMSLLSRSGAPQLLPGKAGSSLTANNSRKV